MKITGADFIAENASWCTALAIPTGEPTSSIEAWASSFTSAPGTAGGSVVNNDYDSYPYRIRITGSKLKLIGSDGRVLDAFGASTVDTNSEVFGTTAIPTDGGVFAASMVDTTYESGTSVVNCWNANFQPLPNQ